MQAITPMATLIDASWLDYLIVAIYFAFVLGIGVMARTLGLGLDRLLPLRAILPAWVTGLAFISANLGAVEIMGMSANGAEIGLPTVHYFWVGAVPAMLFLGVVMMPFYYGSKVRSVPGVHVPAVRHRRPPRQRDQLRRRAAADRGRQPRAAGRHRAARCSAGRSGSPSSWPA